MNSVQIGSAAWAPLRPTGWLSSKPTQTTVSSSGVKPTNQASRRSLVVPVLPAASSVKPAAARRRAGAFVEHAAHHVGDEVRRVAPRDLRGRSVGFFVTSVPPLVIDRMCRSGRSDADVGEHRVRRGDFERRRLEHAERNRRIRLRRVADAEPLPQRGDVVVAGRLRDVNRREVARLRQRVAQRDRPVVLVLVVLRRPDLVVELEGLGLVDMIDAGVTSVRPCAAACSNAAR